MAALPPAAREAFWKLSDKDEPKSAEGIFNCNFFEMDGDGGVYRLICRLNHSCSPCCCHSFDSSRGLGELRAVRAVAAGEELTVAYIELCAPRAQRRQRLREGFGFDCACQACAKPAAGSDERRAALQSLDGLLGELAQPLHALAELALPGGPGGRASEEDLAALVAEAGSAREEGLRVVEEILRLAEEEGQAVATADGVDARACASAVFLLQGQRPLQERWARRCVELHAVAAAPADTAALRQHLEELMLQPAVLPPPAGGDA